MTYEQLKTFCNKLTDEQLKQEIYLSVTDDAVYKIDGGIISEEDEWFDHCDSMGFAKDMEDEFGEDWREEAKEYTLTPKGTVFLISE